MQYAQSLTRSPGPVAQDLPGISISYYDTDVETIKGQTVTERDIHDWANEAERAFVERTSGAIIILLMFLAVMNIAAIILRRRVERRW